MSNYLLAYFAQVLTAISQFLMKKGAIKKKHQKLLKSFFNMYTITGYFILILVTLLTAYVLRVIPLKNIVFINSTGFIFVLILSRFALKEKIEKKHYMGVGIIIFGIILFNIN